MAAATIAPGGPLNRRPDSPTSFVVPQRQMSNQKMRKAVAAFLGSDRRSDGYGGSSGTLHTRLAAIARPHPAQIYNYGGRDYPSFEAAKRANPDMVLASAPPSGAEAVRAYEMARGGAWADSIGSGPIELGTYAYLRGAAPESIRLSGQFDQALGGFAAGAALRQPAGRAARGVLFDVGRPPAGWIRPAAERTPVPLSIARDGATGGEAGAAFGSLLRSPAHRRMADALRRQDFRDINFGVLSKDKFDGINEKLMARNQEPLRDREINVPANVLRKLYEKRVKEGGLSPERFADIAYSAVHSGKSKVLPTRHENIVALINAREGNANLGFLARNPRSGETVLKSAYPRSPKNIPKRRK